MTKSECPWGSLWDPQGTQSGTNQSRMTNVAGQCPPALTSSSEPLYRCPRRLQTNGGSRHSGDFGHVRVSRRSRGGLQRCSSQGDSSGRMSSARHCGRDSGLMHDAAKRLGGVLVRPRPMAAPVSGAIQTPGHRQKLVAAWTRGVLACAPPSCACGGAGPGRPSTGSGQSPGPAAKPWRAQGCGMPRPGPGWRSASARC